MSIIRHIVKLVVLHMYTYYADVITTVYTNAKSNPKPYPNANANANPKPYPKTNTNPSHNPNFSPKLKK